MDCHRGGSQARLLASVFTGSKLGKFRVEGRNRNHNFCHMNDLNTSTVLFRGDWRAVLDFLTGILLKDSVREVRITRKAEHWKVNVTGIKHAKKKSSNPTVGLHDLYW